MANFNEFLSSQNLGQKVCLFGGKPFGIMIFTDFDEFLKASKALNARHRTMLFLREILTKKSVHLT